MHQAASSADSDSGLRTGHSALFRRFLVLAALMFWQGGFFLYAGVVVPIGTEVLGSASEQARITRRVTVWLNWTAVVALVPMAWDVWAVHVGRTRRGRAAV